MTSLTAGAVAALVGGELTGSPDVRIAGVAALDAAGPGDLAFLADPRWAAYLAGTRAGAVLMDPRFRGHAGGPATRIVVADARAAIRTIALRFTPEEGTGWSIHPTARLGRRVRWLGRIAIGAHCDIGADVTFGLDCRVAPGVRIGDGVALGDACVIGPGACLGIAGFSHAAGDHGPTDLPPTGKLRLGHRVTVGALSTIARGSIGTTVIGDDTKFDAQVHVGHNVRVGARCLVMAQAGIAGSTTLEDDVIVAGQAGLADGLRVGAGARIAAQAGVIGDIPPGATVSGYPARDHRQVLRHAAALARLAPHARILEQLAHSAHATAD